MLAAFGIEMLGDQAAQKLAAVHAEAGCGDVHGLLEFDGGTEA
jgi:hypothetical protein